jgi:hypothetical protein
MGLFIRTIGIARATTKIAMANLVYNIKRFVFLRKIAVAGRTSIAQDALFDNSPIRSAKISSCSLVSVRPCENNALIEASSFRVRGFDPAQPRL